MGTGVISQGRMQLVPTKKPSGDPPSRAPTPFLLPSVTTPPNATQHIDPRGAPWAPTPGDATLHLNTPKPRHFPSPQHRASKGQGSCSAQHSLSLSQQPALDGDQMCQEESREGGTLPGQRVTATSGVSMTADTAEEPCAQLPSGDRQP